MRQRNSTTDQSTKGRFRRDTTLGHWIVELLGIAAFAALAALIGAEVYSGTTSFGYLWLLPILAILAYLAADLASGFVHFLMDNFGDEKTPLLGPYFIKPFRDHHTDHLGITHHDFVDTNGNNSLASMPFMLLVWLFVPIGTTIWGYLSGTFFLLLCLGVFMTNQFHKWAHMDTPPQWVARLQWSGLILSKEHHDTHHESPYDTYYCITVGVWNPLFDRINFFARTERLARRYVPGTDPYLRVEREGSLNAVTRHAPNATSRCGRSSRKTCAVCSERSRHSERRK